MEYFLNDLGKFCTYLSTVKQKKSVNMFVLSWALTSVCHIFQTFLPNYTRSPFYLENPNILSPVGDPLPGYGCGSPNNTCI